MDLCQGAKRVIVLMEHTTKDGNPKLVDRCTLPLTGKALVRRVITDLAVLDIGGGSFRVAELAPDVSVSDVRSATGASVVPALARS